MEDTTSRDSGPDRPSATDEITVINRALLKNFSRALLPSIVIVFSLVALTTLGAFLLIAVNRGSGPWGQILAIHLIQVAVGMVLGLFCLFLGAMMCWFGITGTFALNAEGPGSKLSLQGTNVGLVLLVGGLLVCGLSLHKSITASDNSLPGSNQISTRALITASDQESEIAASALNEAVRIASNQLAQIDDEKCRGAAVRIVTALKNHAAKRADSQP